MESQGPHNSDGRREPASISSTLLDRIRARRPEAWQRLVDLYGPVVYRWCRQLGVPQADAADVAQEVFASVAAHLEQFRRDRPNDSFGAWLRTVVRNKIRDYLRQLHSRPEAEGGTAAYQFLLQVPECAEANDASRSSICLEPDRQFARRAMNVVRAEFESRTWEAFWRIVVQGQSPAEVAEAMGQSLHAVYKAKSRVLGRLRQELKEASG